MNIRHLASRILPPFIYDYARKRRNVSRSFGSYEEAAASCTGYDDPGIATAMAYHAKLLYDRLSPPMPTFTPSDVKVAWAARRAVQGGVLNVIDFGGALGYDYFAARAGIPDGVAIGWHVIETAAMKWAGQQFAATLDPQTRRELHFHTSWEDARAACPMPDLVHSSSAIICVPDPIESLRGHIACGAAFMLFARIGLTDGPTLYSAQKRLLSKGVTRLAPGIADRIVSYPLTWPNRDSFESLLQQDYRIIARFEEENPIFTVGDVPVPGYGCLVARKG